MGEKVYWNSNKECYSVVDTTTGRVVEHVNYTALKNAEFHINENGRDKVRTTGTKNVHAWVRGEHIPTKEIDEHRGTVVRYDPEETDTFETVHGEKVKSAKYVFFSEKVIAFKPELC